MLIRLNTWFPIETKETETKFSLFFFVTSVDFQFTENM